MLLEKGGSMVEPFGFLISHYLQFLQLSFQFDVYVYSQTWIYYWILPVLLYSYWFLIKWSILTIPIWIPIIILIDMIRNFNQFYKRHI